MDKLDKLFDRLEFEDSAVQSLHQTCDRCSACCAVYTARCGSSELLCVECLIDDGEESASSYYRVPVRAPARNGWEVLLSAVWESDTYLSDVMNMENQKRRRSRRVKKEKKAAPYVAPVVNKAPTLSMIEQQTSFAFEGFNFEVQCFAGGSRALGIGTPNSDLDIFVRGGDLDRQHVYRAAKARGIDAKLGSFAGFPGVKLTGSASVCEVLFMPWHLWEDYLFEYRHAVRIIRNWTHEERERAIALHRSDKVKFYGLIGISTSEQLASWHV